METLIDRVNRARLAGSPDPEAEAQAGAETRLFAYGTLRPGEMNHHVMEGLGGRWIPARISGTVGTCDVGVHVGMPALRLGEGTVAGLVLVSSALPAAWGRIDAFETDLYARILTIAQTDEGPLLVTVYEFRG